MPRRFVRGVGRGTTQRRLTAWIGFATSEVIIASASTAIFAFSLNAAALALRPFTITRTRLFWHCRSDQVAGSETWGASLGLAVVSDQASAIGITALPTPVTDIGSDLFFTFAENYGRFIIGTASSLEAGRNVMIDSKAMRKVNDDQDVIMTLETLSFSVSALSIVSGRMLLKLH